MDQTKVIHIAAAVITDEQGRILLVRKRRSPWFMQPGGKIEHGERAVNALIRELQEELQIQVVEQDTCFIGQFTDVAANEPGHKLVAEMFTVSTAAETVTASAEIEEILWLDPQAERSIALAPLTEQQILPLVYNQQQSLPAGSQVS